MVTTATPRKASIKKIIPIQIRIYEWLDVFTVFWGATLQLQLKLIKYASNVQSQTETKISSRARTTQI